MKTVTVRKATCHQLSNVCFMQEKTMSNDLITTVHDLVLESPIGAKAIAQAVGKPYSTLLREVNPYDTGAKLGAETLMHIMKTTGNVTPLEKMALEMGYRLEPAEGMGSTVRA